MQGQDDEYFGDSSEDDFDDHFRPVPHPDDRLWRHPSEIAAAAAARQIQAEAPTIELPRPTAAENPAGRRTRIALVAAASVLIVSGGALFAGLFSSSQTVTNQAAPNGLSSAPDAPLQVQPIGRSDFNRPTDELAMELLPFVPRVQAVHATEIHEGGGFFLTTSGHLATSASLVTDADYIVVWTDDLRRWPATVIGSDPISDVALLHIATDEWPAAALAIEDPDTGSLGRGGEYAVAVDYDSATMTVNETQASFGTVTLPGPASAPRVFIAHHDLAGAPIVDSTGAILAMTNHASSPTEGESIATPAWLIERVALDMLVAGHTTHSWLGAEIDFDYETEMIRVVDVATTSPAEQHGLEAGDLIDSIDGEPAVSVEAMVRAIYQKRPGDDIVLSVTRAGGRRIIAVTLGQVPE